MATNNNSNNTDDDNIPSPSPSSSPLHDQQQASSQSQSQSSLPITPLPSDTQQISIGTTIDPAVSVLNDDMTSAESSSKSMTEKNDKAYNSDSNSNSNSTSNVNMNINGNDENGNGTYVNLDMIEAAAKEYGVAKALDQKETDTDKNNANGDADGNDKNDRNGSDNNNDNNDTKKKTTVYKNAYPPCMHPEEQASFFGYILLTWINPIINKGFKQPITLEETLPLRHDMTAEYLTQKFQREWEAEIRLKGAENASIAYALNRAFGWRYWIAGMCQCVANGIGFITPNLLNW
jgi:hypothetical protein